MNPFFTLSCIGRVLGVVGRQWRWNEAQSSTLPPSSTGINLHCSSCLECVCIVSVVVYVCVLCQFVCSHVSYLLCLVSCFKLVWTQLGDDRLHTHRIYDSTTINQGPVIGDIPRIICTKSHLLATWLKDARCFFDPKFVSIDRYFGTQI